MNLIEAEDLDAIIRDERKKTSIKPYQIGNGEWVLLLNNSIYIWDAADYEQYKAECENMRKRALIPSVLEAN